MESPEKSEMVQKTSPTAFEDLRCAWKLYKSNWKTLASYSIIATLGAIGLLIVFAVVVFILFIRIVTILDVSFDSSFYYNFGLLFSIPTSFFMYALLGCTYGLVYDIMSSGDEFAEIKSAFIYFQRYWWQYILIALISGGVSLVFSFNLNYDYLDPSSFAWPNDFILLILVYLGGWLWGLLFSMVNPGVTAHGSLKQAFHENFEIIRQDYKRILKTSGLLYLVFGLPSVIIYLIAPYIYTGQDAFIIVPLIFMGIFFFFQLGIANPLYVIIYTRIYNQSSIPDHETFRMQKEQDKRIRLEKRF